MKKILFAFGIVCGAAFAVNAQDSTATKDQSTQYRTETQSSTQDQATAQDQDKDKDQDKDRKEIQVSELPAMIREQLQSSDYTAWTVDKAYKKEKDGQPVYIVELKKGDDMKKIKFDAQGNVIKEKEKDHDQK